MPGPSSVEMGLNPSVVAQTLLKLVAKGWLPGVVIRIGPLGAQLHPPFGKHSTAVVQAAPSLAPPAQVPPPVQLPPSNAVSSQVSPGAKSTGGSTVSHASPET